MTRTPIDGLVLAAGFFAAASLILVQRFYGALASLNLTVPLSLWVIAAVAGWIAWVVKNRREEGRVGLDRTQLNPMMVANFMVFGKACAWAGAVCGGAYAGGLVYVLPRLATLAAASGDTPPLVAGTLGGLALSVAGVILERVCEVSPPGDGEAVG
mgnify:CR=1 FL=1